MPINFVESTPHTAHDYNFCKKAESGLCVLCRYTGRVGVHVKNKKNKVSGEAAQYFISVFHANFVLL